MYFWTLPIYPHMVQKQNGRRALSPFNIYAPIVIFMFFIIFYCYRWEQLQPCWPGAREVIHISTERIITESTSEKSLPCKLQSAFVSAIIIYTCLTLISDKFQTILTITSIKSQTPEFAWKVSLASTILCSVLIWRSHSHYIFIRQQNNWFNHAHLSLRAWKLSAHQPREAWSTLIHRITFAHG